MNWKMWLGIVISLLLLFLAVHRVDLGQLGEELAKARYAYLIPAMALGLLSALARAVRWHFLLRPVKHIGLGSLFSATMIGLMANNLFPARLGEFVRAYAIGRKEKIGKSASFATVVVERVFDGFAVLIILSLTVLLFSLPLPGWLEKAVILSIVFYVVALGVLVIMRMQIRRSLAVIRFLLKPLPAALRERGARIAASFIEGLRIFHHPQDILIILLLSFFVWIPSSLAVYATFYACGIDLSVPVAFFLQMMFCLAVMIPSAPGYIGIIQWVSVRGLALFQIPQAQALSFSILLQASQYITLTGGGLIYLCKEGFSLRQMKHSAEEMETEAVKE